MNFVVDGSVRRADGAYRVTVQLVRASDGFQVWTRTYERAAARRSELQASVAEHIAFLVSLQVRQASRTLFLRMIPTLASLGIDRYVAMQHFMNAMDEYWSIRLEEGGGDWRVYEQHLRQAIDASPELAFPHLFLANAYEQRLGGMLSYEEAARVAHEELAKAKALGDDNHPFYRWFEGQMYADDGSGLRAGGSAP